MTIVANLVEIITTAVEKNWFSLFGIWFISHFTDWLFLKYEKGAQIDHPQDKIAVKVPSFIRVNRLL